MTRIDVSLVTVGDPDTTTGGYLYHRRMADAAPAHDASLSFVSLPDRSFPLPLLSGAAALQRAQGSDVIVVDSIAAAYVAPWIERNRRVPVVAMLHQPPGGIDHHPLRTLLQARLDRRTYRAADKLLVASETLVADLHRGGLDRDVVLVAPGRDVGAAPVASTGDLRRGRRMALLCVGNWVARKGIVELIDALRRTPDDTATLHLVGDDRADPAYARRVRRLIADSGLTERVVVHGILSREDVASFYASADVFVLASTREPYGTAYGEAMAAGLPVLGWDAGNLPFLARDGVEGFVLPPGDVDGLAAAVIRLAWDDELRRRVGRAAHARAQSFPTWDQTASRFFAELRGVVEKGLTR